MNLKGKKIILGITGSIAAYKSAYLLRSLVREGAEVQVLITPAGKEFITPVTLSALSGRPVHSEFFASTDGSWHSHVDMGLWADLFLIAPASANTLGKMAAGICDNLLLTTFLSVKCPVFIAPAMDLDMYAHAATQKNIDTLRSWGCTIIEPAIGELASGLEGKGRMEEPEKISELVIDFFNADLKKKGLNKTILITAGPTYEKIDPVRFIGNFSSGKMGFALAEECANRNWNVVLITGPVSLQTSHPNIKRINVTSAADMHAEAVKRFPDTDAAILCAAVADYTPAHPDLKKIKRKAQSLSIELVATQDIAANLGQIKHKNQVMVGFALETDDAEKNALGKLKRKNLDFIVLNSLTDPGAGFQTDTNKITILDNSGSKTYFKLKPKTEVSRDIVDHLEALL